MKTFFESHPEAASVGAPRNESFRVMTFRCATCTFEKPVNEYNLQEIGKARKRVNSEFVVTER